jgi:hypothetical protein
MQEYYINCVRRDRYGIITHVGISGNLYEVTEVAQGLLNKQFLAYTFEYNQKAYVSPRKSINGNWFLTTTPDSTTENNLDFLPTC